MLFNSFEFLLFLPAVIMAYYMIPQRYRWVLLLAASYYFYMCWKVEYVLLLMTSTVVDYWCGVKMGSKDTKRERRPFLYLSLAVNLGLLFFFKYFDFVSAGVEHAFAAVNIFYDSPAFDILLPVGISFYTFQTLSYSIDVYRGKAESEKHLGYFALYVSYFPQLVAGPIERPSRLLPQLKQQAVVTVDDFRYGVNKILLGFFKKVVCADTVAIYIDQCFGNIPNGTGLQYYIATLFFSVQLYCDFSGYTDIAMGSARLMGVRLMENFNRPYASSSFAEFWRKWHISLSSWIKDYMYVPLALRYKKWLSPITVFVFTVIGFWHGASWNFILFGMFHGFVMVIQRWYMKQKYTSFFDRSKLGKVFWVLWNFHLLLLTGLLFRLPETWQVMEIIAHIFTDFRIGLDELRSPFQTEMLLGFVVSALALGTIAFNKELKFKYNSLYVIGMLVLIFLLGQDTQNQFIYFQF